MVVRALLVSIAIIATAPVAAAQPAGDYVPDLRAYADAMREGLGDIGVDIHRLDASRQELLVVYSVAEDAGLPDFTLAAVLRLVEPLAERAEQIRLRHTRGKHTLVEMKLHPEQLNSLLESTTTAAQREQIAALLSRTLAAAGIERVATPPLEDSVEQSEPEGATRQQPDTEEETTLPQQREGEAAASEEDATAVSEGGTDPRLLADEILRGLTAQDLENVSVARDAVGMWIIGYENRTWRSEMDALARALEAAGSVLPPAEVLVRVKRQDVIVSHLRLELADFVMLQSGLLSGRTMSRKWQVSAGPGAVEEPVELLAQERSSYLRTDLLMRPAIEYWIGLEHDPLVSHLYLVTDAETTVARGLKANLRFPLQVEPSRRLTMDRALLTWTGRPLDNALATASVGKFGDDLHGYYAEMRTDTDTHQFGVIGSLLDRSFKLSPADGYASALAYYQYDWGELGLKSRLGYGQFIESGDQGLLLSLRRRYGESVIETRAIRTDDGEEGLTFEISVPLGPQRARAPRDLRARISPMAKLDYVSDFNVEGDHLRGPHDLESFRGELSPAYLGASAGRLVRAPDRSPDTGWPVAPSFEGTSGLIRIPTADAAPDGRIFAGISYFDRKHSRVASDDTDAMPTFIGFGFLPNLELVGRLTFFHDVQAFNWDFNLDRSMNVHYRIIRQQGDWIPALAVGAQDVMFGTPVSYLGSGEYLVGSWQRDRARVHLGAGRGKFDPLFGGFELAFGDERRLHLMADYDSDYLNAGMRWFIEDWGTASIGFLGMRNLTGSMTFHADLP